MLRTSMRDTAVMFEGGGGGGWGWGYMLEHTINRQKTITESATG